MDDIEYARAATVEDLKALVGEFEKRDIPYMLIGGYALAALGHARATTDIDILFPATAAIGALVKDALMSLPDHAAKDIDPAWFDEGDNIRVSDVFVVDIMLNANGQTYDALKELATMVELDGMLIRTVNLEGLLLTKRTTRQKDINDCIVIEQALARQLAETDKPAAISIPSDFGQRLKKMGDNDLPPDPENQKPSM